MPVDTFKPVRLEWVKQGNIFTYAHVRGGGEKGEAWHQGGKGPNKHKGVEDFVASVAQLSELGYSRPQRTALICGSAGGLLLGTTNGSEAVKEQVPPARFAGHQLGSQVLLCASFRHVPQSQSSRLRQMPAPQLMRRRQALAMRRPDPAGE